tara:strand:+ start:506 stop:937 length:432 start_codon:yes stop_codon:yes gene_type:complete
MKEILDALEVNPSSIEWVSEKEKWVKIKNIFYRPGKDFNFLLDLIKKEIRTRPDKSQRFEVWECLDVDGNFKESIKERILKNREKLDERKTKQVNNRSVEKLCQTFGVEIHMAQIYLHDLRTNTSNHPEQARQRTFAKQLGLI